MLIQPAFCALFHATAQRMQSNDEKQGDLFIPVYRSSPSKQLF
jgi:hypothetical protein